MDGDAEGAVPPRTAADDSGPTGAIVAAWPAAIAADDRAAVEEAVDEDVDEDGHEAGDEEHAPPDGSPRHLWACYGRTVARLRRVAYRVLRDEHEAEDAAHDAFVAARRSLATLRDPSLLENWLVRIARNAATTRLRRRRRMLPDHRVVAEEPPEGWDPPRVLYRSGSAEPPPASVAALRAEFETVPEAWKRAFLARVYRGLSIGEIAREQGVSPSCIKTRISRVRSRLRRSI